MTEKFGDPKGAEQPFLGIAYAQPSGYLYWYKPNPKKGNTFPCPSGPSSFICPLTLINSILFLIATP